MTTSKGLTEEDEAKEPFAKGCLDTINQRGGGDPLKEEPQWELPPPLGLIS